MYDNTGELKQEVHKSKRLIYLRDHVIWCLISKSRLLCFMLYFELKQIRVSVWNQIILQWLFSWVV